MRKKPQTVSYDGLDEVVNSLSGNTRPLTVFPGSDGIPHVSPGAGLYKKDDPLSRQPQPGGIVKCKVFDMADEADMEAYTKLASMVYSAAKAGKMVVSAIDRRFIEKSGSWKIYFEWVELFTYAPPAVTNVPTLLRKKR